MSKKQNEEFILAMNLLEEEKGISREVIKDALESALILAYKRNYDQASNVEVNFDEVKGSIKVYSVKEVVDEVEDDTLEVSLEEALEINKAYEVGDRIKFEVTPKDFGRIATQTAKHVVMQRIREAERNIIYDEYINYEDEIITGTVERQDHRFVYVKIGRAEAVMPNNEQIPSEDYVMDDRIKVYVAKVDKTNRGPQIIVSRAAPGFLRRLFEQEVPEIYDGVVEIKAVSREAGDRSKVAVVSHDSNVDAVGTCVGPRGSRVQTIVHELNGENMDIIEWNEDPAVFVENAMSPADVIQVDFNEEEQSCIVVVPDSQLSLAIGKRGQNARLAARLTGYKIDIKSEEDYQDYLDEQAELLAQEVQVAEDTYNDEAAAENLDDYDLNKMTEALYPEEHLDLEDQEEAIFEDPEDYEETISELEIDSDQDYEELTEEVAQAVEAEEETEGL